MLAVRNPNLYYGSGLRRRRRPRHRLGGRRRVYRRRHSGMRRRRVYRRHRGRGFFSNIHDFIKKHKLVSTIGNALGSVGVPYAGAIGKAAGVLGYGRRRRYRRRSGLGRRRVHRRRYVGYRSGPLSRVYRRRHGGSLKSLLMSGHKFVKDNRLVSKGLRHFLPNSNLHKAAHSLGYGRRRRRYRRGRGGSLKSLLSSGHKFVKDNRLISKGLRHFLPNSNLHKAAHTLGYGRRSRHYGGANFFSTEQIAMPRFH